MGIFAFRGTHPIRAIHTADGGTGMPAATKRLRGLGMPEKPSRPNSLTAMEAQSDEPSASHEPARPMPQRKTHDAKPTLAELAGVRPTDKPDEGERPKRDRPRLAFRPFHAILTLSCALCASLTMLVQQTIHYSELQHSRSQIRSQAQQQPQQAPQTEQTPAPQENGPTQDASTPDSHDGQDGAQQSNQLDLNTADLGELQTLKGVGPVTAQRILDYRTQIGRFDNVDQLLEVKGIGSKTLAKFRDQVCVR